MTWGGAFIGTVLAFAMCFPKSFGRHLAEIVKAYRAALEVKDE